MDSSPDRYLQRVEGLDAQIWVEPSRGQLFWLRHAPTLFGPPPDATSRLARWWARWWAIATVAPSTNVTVLNLRYQSYLNNVFHRTKLARVGHAVCMPVIVAAMLAALCSVRLGSAPAFPGLHLAVNASLPAAAALAVWWVAWAVKERDPLWGASCVVLAFALYVVANTAYDLRIASAPLAWVVLGSLLQAGSHVLEPLPPRVTRSPHWIPVVEYLLGPPSCRHSAGRTIRRAGQFAAQTAFGTLDELVASPRLLPVLLMEVLWLAGHDPDRRTAWKALVARAIASGNPALDYIGVGGSTFLRIPVRHSP
jgi:hypothetical protein